MDNILSKVEINFGSTVWPGTRPIPSSHYHVGYVLYRDVISLKYSPELKYTRDGTHLGIDHIDEFNFDIRPRPLVNELEIDDHGDIIEINYLDPFHKDGIMFFEEVENFKGSLLRLLGYIIIENDELLWIGLGKFEYENGTRDYENVHVIPKVAILDRRRYEIIS